METKKYYRVDKIRVYEDSFGKTAEEIHKTRSFLTLDEAEKYFNGGSTVWKMKLYEVSDTLIGESDPPPEKPWTDKDYDELRKVLEEIDGYTYTEENWQKLVEEFEREKHEEASYQPEE